LRLSLTDRISTGVPTVQLAHQWRTALFNRDRAPHLSHTKISVGARLSCRIGVSLNRIATRFCTCRERGKGKSRNQKDSRKSWHAENCNAESGEREESWG